MNRYVYINLTERQILCNICLLSWLCSFFPISPPQEIPLLNIGTFSRQELKLEQNSYFKVKIFSQ